MKELVKQGKVYEGKELKILILKARVYSIIFRIKKFGALVITSFCDWSIKIINQILEDENGNKKM